MDRLHVILDMDEDLELKMLRLKKMMKMMSSPKPSERVQRGAEMGIDEALSVLKDRLVDRGEEVIEAALKQYPDVASKIVLTLARKIAEGKWAGKIYGGDLLKLFESLGLHIHLETSIKFYKDGEYKSLSELLRAE